MHGHRSNGGGFTSQRSNACHRAKCGSTRLAAWPFSHVGASPQALSLLLRGGSTTTRFGERSTSFDGFWLEAISGSAGGSAIVKRTSYHPKKKGRRKYVGSSSTEYGDMRVISVGSTSYRINGCAQHQMVAVRSRGNEISCAVTTRLDLGRCSAVPELNR